MLSFHHQQYTIIDLRRRFRTLLLVTVLLATLSGRVSAQGTPTPTGYVEAIVIVERAVVFPQPDRNATALTYLYERERVPILGQSGDGSFLWVVVGDQTGWVLRAQVEISGDATAIPVIGGGTVPATATITPFVASVTPPPLVPTGTPLPTRTPVPTLAGGTPSAAATPDLTSVLPGTPPPLTITLPAGWNGADMQIPYLSLDGDTRYIPLTIYFGPLSGGTQGFIYVYWGFPGVQDLVTKEHNLWADGVQMLRGSLIGDNCNLGVYTQQTFKVGGRDAVGAMYQASECKSESDTAGWFATLMVDDGIFAFYTAVEPWSALADQQVVLQSILDTVVFTGLEQ